MPVQLSQQVIDSSNSRVVLKTRQTASHPSAELCERGITFACAGLQLTSSEGYLVVDNKQKLNRSLIPHGQL